MDAKFFLVMRNFRLDAARSRRQFDALPGNRLAEATFILAREVVETPFLPWYGGYF
jgi:hypothetical protein